ncbi:MAG: hypothetical protein JSS02_03125 [Planctomycetes bacterium]|nr:hypothetical protein [Planctomycetota bacterium]
MDDHARAMLTFASLAGLSQSRGQLGPRDKFLVLAGVAACRGDFTTVATRCRDLVLHHNPVHLLKRFASFESALADEEFQAFLKQLARFCSYEKGEHLLAQLGVAIDVPHAGAASDPAERALQLLEPGAA